MTVRTIIQRCPCGYRYIERRYIKKVTIPHKALLVKDPILGGYCNIAFPRREEIVKRKVLRGDVKFKVLPVLTGSHYYIDAMLGLKESINLLVCPKCGAVLLPEIAMKVKTTEENENPPKNR